MVEGAPGAVLLINQNISKYLLLLIWEVQHHIIEVKIFYLFFFVCLQKLVDLFFLSIILIQLLFIFSHNISIYLILFE